MFRNIREKSMKRIFVVLLLILSVSGLTMAQNDATAYLRIMQLSFVPEVSSTVDIRINDIIAFEGVRWPFATPYIEIASGDHMLEATIVDDDATASTNLTLEAGSRYMVIIEGDYSEDAVQFVVVNETNLPDETGSAAVVVNLTMETIDYFVNEEVLLEDIGPNETSVATLPDGYLSTAAMLDDADDFIFEQEFAAVPDLTLITVLRVSSRGDIQRLFARSSNVTIADYLLSIEGAEPFAEAVRSQTMRAVEESEDGTFTMFLPTGESIESLGDAIPTDPTELETWVANHITLADLPPYNLMGTESLTMLSGNTISLQFEDTESTFWEIEGAPIWWDIRFADGVIYAIDGVIIP